MILIIEKEKMKIIIIYVETNRSFNDIVRSIGHLLKEFELETDDFIFYTSVMAN